MKHRNGAYAQLVHHRQQEPEQAPAAAAHDEIVLAPEPDLETFAGKAAARRSMVMRKSMAPGRQSMAPGRKSIFPGAALIQMVLSDSIIAHWTSLSLRMCRLMQFCVPGDATAPALYACCKLSVHMSSVEVMLSKLA